MRYVVWMGVRLQGVVMLMYVSHGFILCVYLSVCVYAYVCAVVFHYFNCLNGIIEE